MQKPIAAIIFSVIAQGAIAQCVSPVSTQPAAAQPATVHTAAAVQAKPAARPSGELIQTAAAGTRDDMPPAMRETPRTHDANNEDRPHRGGTAMLLAALALMSGIALRRYGASNS